MASQFAQLVSLACHDLRTPLATASGFARTLQRLDDMGQPAARYVEMIGAAADQLADLLDLLGVAARIETRRYEPQLREANTRDLANEAAQRLEEDRASVTGDGARVPADPKWAAVSLAALAEGARRHGGLEAISLGVDGSIVSIGPIVDGAGPIVVGENLRDFGAAVATRVLEASGAAVDLDGDALRVRFPQR